MKTGFYPYTLKSNKYIEIIIDSLRSVGIEVYDYEELRTDKKKLKNLDIVNFNWYETSILSNYSLKTICKMILRISELLKLKFKGIKIIYTVHNKIPHEIGNTNAFLIKIFIKFICKISDRIVILSNGTKVILLEYMHPIEIEKKVCYIPHPNYIGVYEDNQIDFISKFNIDEDELVLLFMGMIKPYKNVELFIDISKSLKHLPIKFIIAGSPSTNEYKEEILKLTASENNIFTMLNFIDDADISSLVRSCDLMVFPYDIKSSLNSGSILLAFSYGKSVISPLISTLQDFDRELFFSYTYDKDVDHRQQLKNQIENAYKTYKENPNKIKQMGDKLQETVLINNSTKVIKEKYFELYKSLLEKK